MKNNKFYSTTAIGVLLLSATASFAEPGNVTEHAKATGLFLFSESNDVVINTNIAEEKQSGDETILTTKDTTLIIENGDKVVLGPHSARVRVNNDTNWGVGISLPKQFSLDGNIEVDTSTGEEKIGKYTVNGVLENGTVTGNYDPVVKKWILNQGYLDKMDLTFLNEDGVPQGTMTIGKSESKQGQVEQSGIYRYLANLSSININGLDTEAQMEILADIGNISTQVDIRYLDGSLKPEDLNGAGMKLDISDVTYNIKDVGSAPMATEGKIDKVLFEYEIDDFKKNSASLGLNFEVSGAEVILNQNSDQGMSAELMASFDKVSPSTTIFSVLVKDIAIDSAIANGTALNDTESMARNMDNVFQSLSSSDTSTVEIRQIKWDSEILDILATGTLKNNIATGMPVGELKITLDGLNKTIAEFNKHPEYGQQVMMAAGMLMAYGQQSGEDSFIYNVTFTEEGSVKVNGMDVFGQ